MLADSCDEEAVIEACELLSRFDAYTHAETDMLNRWTYVEFPPWRGVRDVEAAHMAEVECRRELKDGQVNADYEKQLFRRLTKWYATK